MLKPSCTKKENQNFLFITLLNNWLKNLTTFSFQKLQNDLDSESASDTDFQSISTFENERNITSYWETFTPATEEEICEIINASPPKSCDSDPIPT